MGNMRGCIFIRFNPRICKRCDRKDEILSNPSLVSIHASVKDATYIRERCQCWIMVSIHASVKDATGCSIRLSQFQYSFNPRICKRCDVNA